MTTPERQKGVRLEQYVAVHAAVAEGFELERVLEHEDLALEHWADADEAWAELMMDSAADDYVLVDHYDRLLVARQDLFRRSIQPLDDDLQAWLDFQRTWAQSDDPLARLTEMGMVRGDVARLTRHWSIQIVENEQLRDRAMALMQQPPGELPTVQVEALRLPPPVRGAAAAPPDSDFPDEDDDEPDSEPGAAPLPPLLVTLPTGDEQDPHTPRVEDLPATDDQPARQRFATAGFVLTPDAPALPFQPSTKDGDAGGGGKPLLDPTIMPFAPKKSDDE